MSETQTTTRVDEVCRLFNELSNVQRMNGTKAARRREGVGTDPIAKLLAEATREHDKTSLRLIKLRSKALATQVKQESPALAGELRGLCKVAYWALEMEPKPAS